MKIAIITLSGYDNLGNRLQNLAMEKIFRKYSSEVITLFQGVGEIYSPNNDESFYAHYKKLKPIYGEDYVSIKNNIMKNTDDNITFKKERLERFISLKKFSEKYLNEIDYNLPENQVPNSIEKQYDYFVVGSDQVWNPLWATPNRLLAFTRKEKKIAFATSFGVSIIPESMTNFYKELLSNINYLAVREIRGKEIIKSLVNRDVPVLLDPTLVLPKNEWLNHLKPHEVKPGKKYLLTYILGRYTKKITEDVEYISRRYDLDVVNLGRLEEPKFINTDPEEFLDYIIDAEILLTDSYHGVIFSNLLNTPYIIYERNDHLPEMNSRIRTLDLFFNVKKRDRKKINLADEKILYYKDDLFEFKKDKLVLESKKFLKTIFSNQ